MKYKSLLLGAVAMLGVSAQAQDFTLEREMPAAPEFTTWAAGDTTYLYNVGGKGFYTNHQDGTSGPYYGTRASVNDTIGQLVVFTRTNPAGTEEEFTESEYALDNSYLFVSYVTKFSSFRCTFAESWNSIWTDNNSHDYRYFNVVKDGKYIKIERNTGMDGVADGGVASEGIYLGLDPNEDGIVNLDTAAAWGDNVLWVPVSRETYEAYMPAAKAQLALVSAANKLKAAIVAALAANEGLDLSEQVAVYNNASATVADLNAAQATISQAIIDFQSGKATPENPIELTSALTNTTFDTVGDFTGWSGSGFGAGGTTHTNAEVFGKNFDTYQVVTGLKAGVYKMTVNGYTRKSDVATDWTAWLNGEPAETKIYIESTTYGRSDARIKHIVEGASETSVTSADNESATEVTDADGVTKTIYTPNTMLSAEDYFHNADGTSTDRYQNEVYGVIAEGDTLRIGAYSTTAGSGDWSIFDDFRLFYLGNTDAAYTAIKENALASNLYEVPAETYYSQAEVDAYQAAYAELQAATGVAVLEKAAAAAAAVDSITASTTSYNKYVTLLNEIDTWFTEGEEAGMNMEIKDVAWLADYLQCEASDETDYVYPHGVKNEILPEGSYAGSLSNQEITAEYDSVYAWYQAAVKNALVPGSDMTSLIVNPGFEEELVNGIAKGWSLDTSAGGTSSLTNWRGGDSSNYCAEAYMQNFDVYQIVNGLPNGLYAVSVQAFYRTGPGWTEDAYNAYLADPDMTGDAKVLAEVYFNDFSQKIRNVYEISFTENLASDCQATSDGKYFPNGMSSASAAFSLEDESQNYTMSAYGLVTDGTMRLGIRKLNADSPSGSWTLWDNFKITYVGKDPVALSSVIDNYLERVTALEGASYGLPDQEALAAAVAAAEAAQDANDADQLYDALNNLVQAVNTANNSVSIYATINELKLTIPEKITEYTDADPDVQAEASELYDEVDQIISSQSLSGAELAAYEAKINDVLARLRVPQVDPDVSDDNPQDFTSMIVNPSFDDNTTDGWNATGSSSFGDVSNGTGENYNKTFNTYQDITNLPAGTYLVSVKGISRYGTYENDYSVWSAANDKQASDPSYVDPTLTTYLYATGSEGTASTQVKHLSEGAIDNSDLGGVAVGSGSLYVPNTMAEANTWFHMTDEAGNELDTYTVSIYVNVGEDGKLRIGVMNADSSLPSNSWNIFDDFQLWYLGTKSSHAQDDDKGAVVIENVDSNAQTVNTAIYTLSGARVSSLQKGINIVKQQQADGTVKVVKMFVK